MSKSGLFGHFAQAELQLASIDAAAADYAEVVAPGPRAEPGLRGWGPLRALR